MSSKGQAGTNGNGDPGVIAAAKKTLATLASIDPRGEPRNVNGPEGAVTEFGGVYNICRCNQKGAIRTADIELAQKVVADEKATLDDCVKALRPLARLPFDFRVEKADEALYVFPGAGGTIVPVSNGMIQAARAIVDGE